MTNEESGSESPLSRPTNTDHDSPIIVPDLLKAGYLLGIVILVVGFNLVILPGFASQVAYSEQQVDAVAAIDVDATEHNRSYPKSYVLSVWDENRMYNYHVSGNAESYGFADGQYQRFRSGTSPATQYQRLRDRVGYVVLSTVDATAPTESVEAQLLDEFDEASDAHLAHYRLLYASGDGEVAAFALVPGATITGTTAPNQTVTVTTNRTISGHSITYQRTTTSDGNGQYSVRVAYPGEYSIGKHHATVPGSAVYNASTVRAD